MITHHTIMSKIYRFFGLCLIIFCGGFLFYVSLEARHAEETLARTKVEITKQQQQISVLRAEIAHLSHPKRLEKIAKKQGYITANADTYTTFDTFNDTEKNFTLAQHSTIPPIPQRRPIQLVKATDQAQTQKDRFQTVLSLFTQ